ncbi:MAG: hypothetical protein ACRDPR_02560, partial [Nocardioidaceae bacterium]
MKPFVDDVLTVSGVTEKPFDLMTTAALAVWGDSLFVSTLNVFAAYVAAAGLVIPWMRSWRDVPWGAAHKAPASVIVTVEPLVVAVAVQSVNPATTETGGVAGIDVNAGLNAAITWSPAVKALEEPFPRWNATVQFATAPAVWVEPTNVTFEIAATYGPTTGPPPGAPAGTTGSVETSERERARFTRPFPAPPASVFLARRPTITPGPALTSFA